MDYEKESEEEEDDLDVYTEDTVQYKKAKAHNNIMLKM